METEEEFCGSVRTSRRSNGCQNGVWLNGRLSDVRVDQCGFSGGQASFDAGVEVALA
jgi:hypothetical protein